MAKPKSTSVVHSESLILDLLIIVDEALSLRTTSDHAGAARAPNPLYDRAALGRLVHELIAVLARACPVDEESVKAVVEELVVRSVSAQTHRVALRACLRSAWSRYATCFAPPPGSVLVGREVAVPGGRLDLVWMPPGGSLFADELKTGALTDRFDGDLAYAQVRRELAGALERYGRCFLGIRLVRLADPAGSLFLDREGRLRPLQERRLA